MVVWELFFSFHYLFPKSCLRPNERIWTSGTSDTCRLTNEKISLWDDMEVPEESFHWSSWDSRTCYPRRAFIQGLSDDILKTNPWLPSLSCSLTTFGIYLVSFCCNGSLWDFKRKNDSPSYRLKEEEPKHEMSKAAGLQLNRYCWQY